MKTNQLRIVKVELEEGLILKNNKESYEVLQVTRNKMIAKIQNLETLNTSTHTVEEIAKYFTTDTGEKIIDTHTKELKRLKHSAN